LPNFKVRLVPDSKGVTVLSTETVRERAMSNDLPVAAHSARRAIASDVHLAGWANVALGIWLMVSPWVLGYGDGDPWWNPIVAGIVVASCAAGRLVGAVTEAALSRVNFLAGLWLVLSAFWLPPNAESAVSNATVGVLVTLLALLSLSAARAAR
jgi:hypothetical protein